MRVLVTGGAGYLGSHLVDLLCDEGHQVRVLDDLSTGKVSNIEHRLTEIAFTDGSILDEELVQREVAEVELVFHLAAAVGVQNIVDDPLHGMLVNSRGTEHVLQACSRSWCKVVLASTSEVYGRTTKLPMSEDDDRVLGSTTVPRWSYSTAKALDEHLALAYADRGLPVAIVRYFNSYGTRIDTRGYGSVIANFLRQASAGEPITVHGDGSQTRCFTYADDSVLGTYLAGTLDEAVGQVFNIGNARRTTVTELAQMVVDLTGTASPVVSVSHEDRYGKRFEDTPHRVPDVTRARDVLGWEAQVTLEDGLARVVKWWRETHG